MTTLGTPDFVAAFATSVVPYPRTPAAAAAIAAAASIRLERFTFLGLLFT
jgi:hypothetical protein